MGIYAAHRTARRQSRTWLIMFEWRLQRAPDPSGRTATWHSAHGRADAGWCNGNTADFGSVVLGSNPSPAALTYLQRTPPSVSLCVGARDVFYSLFLSRAPCLRESSIEDGARTATDIRPKRWWRGPCRVPLGHGGQSSMGRVIHIWFKMWIRGCGKLSKPVHEPTELAATVSTNQTGLRPHKGRTKGGGWRSQSP